MKPSFSTAASRERNTFAWLNPIPAIRLISPIALMLTMLAGVCRGEDWKIPGNAPLLTQWARQVSPTSALPEYPRPQMSRETWQNFNGLWDYTVTAKQEEKVPTTYTGKILVPYPIESALSGVMKAFLPTERLWYHRKLTLPEAWRNQRVLLHFGAVDWETTVWLNGRELGGHRGGYDAFTFDLTRALKPGEAQDLVISVLDPSDTSWQLHGKQTLHPAGCSYTATSGIWQTVWMEPVPMTTSVESLKMVPDLAKGVLKLTVTGRVGNEPLALEVKAFDAMHEVSSASGQAGFELSPVLRENKVSFYKNTGSWFNTEVVVPMKNAKLWSPENPFLYELVVALKDTQGKTLDTVKSYFGMRSLGKQTDPKGFTRFLLNGKPALMAGALDQGFWPDGIYTAATDEALKYDIQIAKKAGLNIIRKHVKIEPERFYYWCDKLGLMVLQDMPTGSEGDPKNRSSHFPRSLRSMRTGEARLDSTILESPFNHCLVSLQRRLGPARHLALCGLDKPTRSLAIGG